MGEEPSNQWGVIIHLRGRTLLLIQTGMCYRVLSVCCREEGYCGPPGRCDLACVRFVVYGARDMKIPLGKLVNCSHCELIVILFMVNWKLWVICLF